VTSPRDPDGSAAPVGEPLLESVARTIDGLVAERVASRIASGDPDVWGPAARDEAARRLGWTRSHETSRPLLEPIVRLRDELRGEGVDRVVLCGMGGSSLAPEVICASAGVDLVVLDSTHPGQVRAAMTDLARTVVIVSSKSGTTVETDSQRRIVENAFTEAGIDHRRRMVVVSDPGSPLAELGSTEGYRAVFLADPEVGGRYSALTAFGLVPSGLAGADVSDLLAAAAEIAPALGADSPDNPGLRLAAVLAGSPSGSAHGGARDKVAIVGEGGPTGFGDWAEQLVAESTGKEGRGLLPVVVDGDGPQLRSPADDVVVARVARGAAVAVEATAPASVAVSGPLGAQFLLWEHATAAAGRLLGINPFDQPDVESAKAAARRFLDDEPVDAEADPAGDDVAITATEGLLRPGDTAVPDAVARLLATVPANGYVAIMAYLDRGRHPELPAVRAAVAGRTGRPTTFGWGPRFLHSTGQYHKGGPPVGVFLQITDRPLQDMSIPGRPFTLGRLIAAQAAGDAAVLADHGRPVLTLAVSSLQGMEVVHRALEGTP
jgi:glucose-6-phosphate isomerase